jgi:hypothetical protein
MPSPDPASPAVPSAVPTHAMPSDAVPTQAMPTQAMPTHAVPAVPAAPEMVAFVAALPKVELHLHLVGSASLDTVLALARRHAAEGCRPSSARCASSTLGLVFDADAALGPDGHVSGPATCSPVQFGNHGLGNRECASACIGPVPGISCAGSPFGGRDTAQPVRSTDLRRRDQDLRIRRRRGLRSAPTGCSLEFEHVQNNGSTGLPRRGVTP